MRILAIESSCDETAAAYLEVDRAKIKRLEHIVSSQLIHAKYGGVVPEVAARAHAETMPKLLAALAKKVVGSEDGEKLGKKIDVVAATRGPGLVTSLRVGLDTARALAIAWRKKLVGVNHIEGHIYANWLGNKTLQAASPKKIFPALILVVSGGHTELLLMKDHGDHRLLGATRDDASGEAFDKSAKLMGLGYPGGPAISRLAAKGNPFAVDFPRPMLHEANYDFSFSGLKTAVRYFIDDHRDKMSDSQFTADLAASVEQAIVEVLVAKTIRAARDTGAKTLMLAGGVAANKKLRIMLAAATAEKLPNVAFMEPPLEYCTDNAAMIAMAAAYRALAKDFKQPSKTDVDPNWELGRM
ncbi:tRNA (adenosine(37)-N6)-threonylcarbamoyltransferase complex transferase subunit TsaD [Candidatus Uhrbacteria bacterium]|nr:tRNA (adenosine(37)-N6)-threonylcarbamoyltransferase complex transferase subunit TsaD [Candidatus Uhrbacteria bacterium]